MASAASPSSFLHPVDPSSGEALAPVACTTMEQLAQVVAEARAAQPAWAALTGALLGR